MKSKIRLFLLLLSLVLTFTALPSSADGACYNWYFKKNDSHQKPPLPSDFSFISDRGGLWCGKGEDKVIYLTFDAGYENGNIEKILNAMQKHNARGAFFILENLVCRNTDLVLRMANEGHLVCNHTAKHPDMSKITDKDAFGCQLKTMEEIYTEKTGLTLAPYYRPPQGKFSQSNLEYAKELGYHTVFWSFAYADWDNNRQMNPETAMKEILEHTHPGMVILLHPTSNTNAEIIDRLLTAWEDMGYRFGSLDELQGK